MNEPKGKLLILSPAPQIQSGVSTRSIMILMLLALLPATVFGISIFGLPALLLVLTSMASAVAGELLFQLATRQRLRVGDLSSAVTGLLLALVCPPGLPLWMVALGSLFAVVVAKEFFGGIGSNPFNPALTGRAFLLLSFPAAMTTWQEPATMIANKAAQFAGLDALSGATPLSALRDAGGLHAVMQSLGVNTRPELYNLLFMGDRPGCLGETSILLILIGGALLLATRVIKPAIPVSMLGMTLIASWIFGFDPLFSLLSGGVVFGAFFMATDYSSSPVSPIGRWVYGAAIGLITVLIRKFGAFPEGVTYAILAMNAVVPFLDRIRQKAAARSRKS